MFEVFFGNARANKDYEQLDEKMRQRVNEFCEIIKSIAVPFRFYDIRKIEGRTNEFRVRLGKYRLTYFVDGVLHRIYILKMELRDETTYKY